MSAVAGRPRLPIGLAGMVAIIVAVEAALAPGPTNPLADIWAEAYERSDSDEVRGSAVLCLGDSQVKLGINAVALGRRLGVPAYNLAVHAGQPAAAEALLRRALGAGASPRAIIVGFHPAVLAYEARTNLRQWPEVLGAWDCARLAFEARDARLATSGLLGYAFPSWKSRMEIRRDLVAALRGCSDPQALDVARGRAERAQGRGSVVATGDPAFRDEMTSRNNVATFATWKPRRENLAALRRLLALAGSRAIPLYWVTPALSPSERDRRDRSGLAASYGRFLDRMQVEFPRLVVLDSSGLDLDASVFVDSLHLDRRGALALTEAVGSAIERPGPRRIALGPSSPRAEIIARDSPPPGRTR